MLEVKTSFLISSEAVFPTSEYRQENISQTLKDFMTLLQVLLKGFKVLTFGTIIIKAAVTIKVVF